MNDKELDLLNRFATKYKIDCVPSEKKYDFWDFTYEWDSRKFYCEMKQRSFTLDYAKEKYPDGLILEMHKYERILRKAKNEKQSQGLYINFFDCDSVLVFNLNKTRIKKWSWRTMPESTDFGRKRYVYKYVTFLDYDKGKVLYI
tara:strand:+ start:1929 stop:2360 length:432 start_codon:yes stop_codon:yes gene_type:complete